MTAARIIVAGATTAVTRRTNFRKAFLAPWVSLVRDTYVYALADAQRHTGVAVHHGTLVVTHHHTEVTPSRNNLPEFTRRVHGDMSCALNTLLASERYEAPRQLWDDRGPHYMRLVDAAAQASHLVYSQVNCVAAGLVERPEDMPDYTFDFGLWRTGYVEVERPPVFFDETRPKRLRLEVTAPPLLYAAFGGDIDALVHHMERLRERALRALRDKREGPVVGVKRILRLHPWSEPRTQRESGGRPVPTFRVGARGIVGQEVEVSCARETTWFRRTHDGVRRARRDGDTMKRFPFGTYEWSVLHGAPVEPRPPSDAVLTHPGPLLSDVDEMFSREREGREEQRASTHAMLDEVATAFVDEADTILEHTACDIQDEVAVRGRSAISGRDSAHAAADTALAEVVMVRHRFDRRAPIDKRAARRVVVLRDARRGRPRKNDDPPG